MDANIKNTIEWVTAVMLIGFCAFTIKSCVIEQEKLVIERLKIPHKVERSITSKASMSVEAAPTTK